MHRYLSTHSEPRNRDLHMTSYPRLMLHEALFATPVNCRAGALKMNTCIGTRQLTVNTCLVIAYDVLKPPCMAATVAYPNPMHRRPIVVAYKQCGLLIRARGWQVP